MQTSRGKQRNGNSVSGNNPRRLSLCAKAVTPNLWRKLGGRLPGRRWVVGEMRWLVWRPRVTGIRIKGRAAWGTPGALVSAHPIHKSYLSGLVKIGDLGPGHQKCLPEGRRLWSRRSSSRSFGMGSIESQSYLESACAGLQPE